MEFKVFNNLPDEAVYIRTTVFVEEQGFKVEFDTTDEYANHVIIYHDDGKPVAVGRFFTDDNIKYHIGRVAVLSNYRKYGYGKKIMDIMEDEIKKIGGKIIVLSAQCQAQGFYGKCGYIAVGDTYLDEHCPHIKMFKEL